ncbi:two-component system OmpR family response regulator [Agrobacterium larrymoorei]|uniref:Two-component system OmpR family response regulator n=1 Tax=Agrobacterium larrymoorei TaxID=160699 RepID=A0AAJ2ER97_9HYPH|nr:response regulator transcription factor [Agrobacterium larrymoorei]MDR6100193.1 two-component system OmpR family response regulator [Agrobacterium larrymoorei]
MKPIILVVDDDPDIRTVIRIAAENANMTVIDAPDGRIALDVLEQKNPDLVILDVGMPTMDGFECFKAIRGRSSVPVLFLTAQDDEVNRVLAFELGADDYVSKPFSPRELVLRIKAILARCKAVPETDLRHGDLAIDFQRRTCTLGGKIMNLTVTEFALLRALLSQPGFVINRDALIDVVYAGNTWLSGRTIDSHVRNIRSKAALLGYHDIVETVRGVGLKLGACTGGSRTD